MVCTLYGNAKKTGIDISKKDKKNISVLLKKTFKKHPKSDRIYFIAKINVLK